MTDSIKRHYLTGGPENVVPLVPAPKSNDRFLEFVFGKGATVWTTNFRVDPSTAGNGHWKGKFATLPAVHAKDEAQSNTYFCTSTFTGDRPENKRRRSDSFKALHVVVLDDVGTKGQPLRHIKAKLAPSYVIETSKGNFQVGYVLDKPCSDFRTASLLMDALNGNLGDPSAKGANRVVRLPYGVNTKGGTLWKCQFEDFTGTRYSVPEIATAFAVDVAAPLLTKSGRGSEEVGEGDCYAPATLDEVEAALHHIKPWELEYDHGDATAGKPAYIKVLQAIHSEHPSESGRELAIRWASGELHGVENERYKPDEVHKRWNGFNQLGNVQGRVTFGTIRMAAKANGWLPLGEDPDNWMTKTLQRTQRGQVKTTLGNCITCVQSLPITLTFDEFTQRDYTDGKPVEDDDLSKVRVLIENTYGAAFGKDMTHDAIIAVAKENRFDSLKEYIEGLPPHNGTDYIGQMCGLMGIETDLEQAFIKRQLIGGIARALRPGVKDDTAVILIGPQGGGKSQFIEALSPSPEWFDDTISGKLSNKDELAKMGGKWLVELAELASLDRTNRETSKQFMSTKTDRYREPYGRKTGDHPRRCSIWGSTNESRHLSDETGNRRFWPVNCPTPMAAATWLRDGNRDLVWGQALALYRAGNKWWLNDEEAEQQKIIAELHRKKSMVEQLLEQWWENGAGPFHIEPIEARTSGVEPDEDGVYRKQFVQTIDVQEYLKEAMKIAPTPHQVADGLKLIGFIAHPTPTGEGKATTYQYKDGGQRRTVPRGFASPRFSAELEGLSRSDRGRRIIEEINRDN